MARQKLGQHFLRSSRILERISEAACGDHSELAVEVGPGRGALTEHLLGRADRVVALEVDQELIGDLQARWRSEVRLEVRHQDALKTDFSEFGPGVLAGNLPYYAATAIISRYLWKPGDLRQGVFLIQKEVADRICASPGTRDYGYLSVEAQFLAEAKRLFTVPPGAFQPPPKVHSAVIRLTPRTALPDAADAKRFLAFASECFRQKRKTLRNNLAALFPKRAITDDSRMGLRAEQLSLEELQDLYRSLTEISSSQ